VEEKASDEKSKLTIIIFAVIIIVLIIVIVYFVGKYAPNIYSKIPFTTPLVQQAVQPVKQTATVQQQPDNLKKLSELANLKTEPISIDQFLEASKINDDEKSTLLEEMTKEYTKEDDNVVDERQNNTEEQQNAVDNNNIEYDFSHTEPQSEIKPIEEPIEIKNQIEEIKYTSNKKPPKKTAKKAAKNIEPQEDTIKPSDIFDFDMP
jgi:hypothetical protein